MAASRKSEFAEVFEDDFNPVSYRTIRSLEDSEMYLKRLETRLKKVKGNTSKELFLKGLHEMKDTHMHQLINRPLQNETEKYFTEGRDLSDEVSYIERKLFPEKIAISTEELYALIEADILAKETEDLSELKSETPEK